MSIKPEVKPLRWLGDSRRRLREFAEVARQRAGFELWEVQQGHEPSDWKPTSSVGKGVKEIRVHADGEHRVLYVAKFEEAVYVLHAFEKKTRRTSKQDIDLAAERCKARSRSGGRSMKKQLKVERGSGNVFEDLGFTGAEAENLQLRAKLMSRVRTEASGMTQAQAAKRFGVTQPRLNDLLRGKIDKFSLDALVNMLASAGLRVELKVKKAA